MFVKCSLFIFLSVRSILPLAPMTITTLLLLAQGCIVGVLCGHFYVRHRAIRANKIKHLIEIPGDALMLAMIMLIFFVEFFVHYAIAAQWEIVSSTYFSRCAITASGLAAGITIGRTMTYLSKYLKAESTSLSKP